MSRVPSPSLTKPAHLPETSFGRVVLEGEMEHETYDSKQCEKLRFSKVASYEMIALMPCIVVQCQKGHIEALDTIPSTASSTFSWNSRRLPLDYQMTTTLCFVVTSSPLHQSPQAVYQLHHPMMIVQMKEREKKEDSGVLFTKQRNETQGKKKDPTLALLGTQSRGHSWIELFHDSRNSLSSD